MNWDIQRMMSLPSASFEGLFAVRDDNLWVSVYHIFRLVTLSLMSLSEKVCSLMAVCFIGRWW